MSFVLSSFTILLTDCLTTEPDLVSLPKTDEDDLYVIKNRTGRSLDNGNVNNMDL